MSNRWRITINMFVLYAATFAVGLAAAWRHALRPETIAVAPLELTLGNALVFVAVFLVFTVFLLKFGRASAFSLKLFLALALVAGAQFVLAGWVSPLYSIGGALLLLVVLRLAPVVLVHDIAIMLGIGGVAGLMGLSITPLIAAGILAVLSLYDIISVYRTRHMVALAGRMMASGAVFGFLVPAKWQGFFMRTRQALEAREVMVLGSGDIGLPLVLATSAVSTSLPAAIMVSAFALAGMTLMHWLFMRQEEPMPMAALPPIAASAILGYVLATLLHL